MQPRKATARDDVSTMRTGKTVQKREQKPTFGAGQNKTRTFIRKMNEKMKTAARKTGFAMKTAWKPVTTTIATAVILVTLNHFAVNTANAQIKENEKNDEYALVNNNPDTTRAPMQKTIKLEEFSGYLNEATSRVNWRTDEKIEIIDASGKNILIDDGDGALKKLGSMPRIDTTLHGRKTVYAIDGDKVYIFQPFMRTGEETPLSHTTIPSGKIYTGKNQYYAGDDGAVFISETAYLVIAGTDQIYSKDLGKNIIKENSYTITKGNDGRVGITPVEWNGYVLWLSLKDGKWETKKPETTSSGK